MLGCTERITLVHHNKDAEDTYSCIVIPCASWFEKTTISTAADGAKPLNTYEVRAFSPFHGVFPALGDYCVKGMVQSVGKPADLKGTAHFRITSIGDNRRGGLPHIRISGQ